MKLFPQVVITMTTVPGWSPQDTMMKIMNLSKIMDFTMRKESTYYIRSLRGTFPSWFKMYLKLFSIIQQILCYNQQLNLFGQRIWTCSKSVAIAVFGYRSHLIVGDCFKPSNNSICVFIVTASCCSVICYGDQSVNGLSIWKGKGYIHTFKRQVLL